MEAGDARGPGPRRGDLLGDQILAYHLGGPKRDKVDSDEPVSNRIAVVHRRLESLYNDPNNNSVLSRNTKIIEPELSF